MKRYHRYGGRQRWKLTQARRSAAPVLCWG